MATPGRINRASKTLPGQWQRTGAIPMGQLQFTSGRAKLTTFESISASLRRFGLWGFPLNFKPIVRPGEVFASKWDKVPLVRWRPYQGRPPTAAEVKAWIAKYPWAKGAGLPTGPAIGIFVIEGDGA